MMKLKFIVAFKSNISYSISYDFLSPVKFLVTSLTEDLLLTCIKLGLPHHNDNWLVVLSCLCRHDKDMKKFVPFGDLVNLSLAN